MHERLAKLRKGKKLTQEQLAKNVGITRSALSQYETGARTPDYEIVQRLAEYFDVSIDYLVGRTGEPKTMNDKTEKHPAEKLREYIDMGMSNDDIKKRMDFVVDVFQLTDEEIDETISFLRWRLDEKKKREAFASKSHEL
jgi:transcriptional regulator with XRE-family HTH domain